MSETMKIAIPSDDKATLSQHFGRTLGFIIYEVANRKITGEEFRLNTFTGHATGQHHDHGHDHDHSHAGHLHQGGHSFHSHEGILSALHDCEVVIAGGMGPRLYEDLTSNGKQVYITRQNDVRKAVELFLSDNLTSDKETCRHH